MKTQSRIKLPCNGKKPTLFLVVGKSGSGKNYFCEKMGFRNIPSYTTRLRRPGEVDGVEHVFATALEWQRLRGTKNFDTKVAAWTIFHNHAYWTTVADINDREYGVFIVDPDGVRTIDKYVKTKRALNRSFRIIYVKAPALTRFRRMYVRDIWRQWSWTQEINAFRNDGCCMVTAYVYAALAFVGFLAVGVKKVVSRIAHDARVFRGFEKEFSVDYTIKG